jgi:hypothetical protein
MEGFVKRSQLQGRKLTLPQRSFELTTRLCLARDPSKSTLRSERSFG